MQTQTFKQTNVDRIDGEIDRFRAELDEILEALRIIDTKGKQATVRTSVEWCPQASEALLTSRVPDLKLQTRGPQVHHLGEERT